MQHLTAIRRRTGLQMGLILSATALGLAACGPDKEAFTALNITGASYAQDFRLTDAHGQIRSLQDFRGKVVVVFFGFTQCPDVCPTALQELVEAKQLLGADGERLQGIFVTIDPERDQPALLQAYMANFDPSFVALRPTPAELPALAKAFKIYYKKVDGPTPTSYTMEHSAGSYLYDPDGKLRLYARHASGASALAGDVRRLLQVRPD